jgi:hypothetical protein
MGSNAKMRERFDAYFIAEKMGKRGGDCLPKQFLPPYLMKGLLG